MRPVPREVHATIVRDAAMLLRRAQGPGGARAADRAFVFALARRAGRVRGAELQRYDWAPVHLDVQRWYAAQRGRDLQGLLDEVQAEGAARIQEWIGECNSLAQKWNEHKNAATWQLEDAVDPARRQALQQMLAEVEVHKKDLRDTIDWLYWAYDTFFGGEEGREVAPPPPPAARLKRVPIQIQQPAPPPGMAAGVPNEAPGSWGGDGLAFAYPPGMAAGVPNEALGALPAALVLSVGAIVSVAMLLAFLASEWNDWAQFKERIDVIQVNPGLKDELAPPSEKKGLLDDLGGKALTVAAWGLGGLAAVKYGPDLIRAFLKGNR